MKNTPVLLLEAEKEGRRYTLTLPVGSPFGEAYDVVFQMLREVLEMSKTAVDSAQPKEASGDPSANS